MAVAQIFSPSEIILLLKNRLTITDNLWEKRDSEDTDQENALFFKYYFDIYVAIEATLRGIVSVYSRRNRVGRTIHAFAIPDDTKMPYFFDEDKMAEIVNECDVLIGTTQNEFNKYRKHSIVLSGLVTIYNFTDFSIFKELYKACRKSRNTLAHGLNAYNSNIDFSISNLDEHMFVFYMLHHYYRRIYR